MVKICPICKASFPSKETLAAHMNSVHSKGNRQRPRRSAQQNVSTNLLVRKELSTITISANSVVAFEICPGKSGCTMLDNIANMYEEYKIVSWTVIFKPIVGTNTNGYYTAGVTYGKSQRPQKVGEIASLSPALTNPLYKQSSLSVNPRKIMGQPWLPVSDGQNAVTAGAILFGSTSTSIQVWISYKVLFNGPTPIGRNTMDEMFEYDAKTRVWRNVEGNRVDRVDYDEPVTGTIDIGSGDTATFNSQLSSISQLINTYREIHRMVTTIFGTVHFIADTLGFVLPILSVPAIMHVTRRPFRPIVDRLLELGYRIVEKEDPGAGGSEPNTGQTESSSEEDDQEA